MKEILNINRIKEQLEKEADRHKTLAEGWGKVERVRTKAGKDFKILEKNFMNCSIDKRIESCVNLYIFVESQKSGYVEDSIFLKNYVKQDKAGKWFVSSVDVLEALGKVEIDPERVTDRGYKNGDFVLTVDELEKVIAYEITNHKKQVAEIEKELESLEKETAKVEKAIQDFRSVLFECSPDIQSIIKRQLHNNNSVLY